MPLRSILKCVCGGAPCIPEMKEEMGVCSRTVFGMEPSQMSFLFFLVSAAAAGGLVPMLENTSGGAQEMKIKVRRSGSLFRGRGASFGGFSNVAIPKKPIDGATRKRTALLFCLLVISLGFDFSSLSAQVEFNLHVLLALVPFCPSLLSLFTGGKLKANRSIICRVFFFLSLSPFSEAIIPHNTYNIEQAFSFSPVPLAAYSRLFKDVLKEEEAGRKETASAVVSKVL